MYDIEIKYRFRGGDEDWLEWPYYPELKPVDLISFDIMLNGKFYSFDRHEGFEEELQKLEMWRELST